MSRSAFEKIEVEPVRRVAYKPEEAAASLGISPRTLHDWQKRPGFPSFKIAGTVRIPIDDLRRWLADQIEPGEGPEENEDDNE